MTVTVLDDGGGTVTFNRTSPDTLSVFNGATNSDGATSFTLTNGQYVTLNQAASGIWEARVTASGGNGLPSAQIGDTIRYNVNGDSVWDAVNFTAKSTLINWDIGGGSMFISGAHQQGIVAAGTASNVYPTLIDGGGVTYTSSASASTNTIIGLEQGTGGNYGTYGLASFYRWTMRFAAVSTANVRYWMGLGVFFNGGTGGNTVGNGAPAISSAAYATNTPNKSTVGFRYSAGTDTAWQACAVTAGSSVGTQTCTSTGVALDTNPHFFEMTTTGTVVTYFIDHTLVATVSTNVPPIALTCCETQAVTFWTGDNQNTANAVAATHYWMAISEK
jgi:hypothetical protein